MYVDVSVAECFAPSKSDASCNGVARICCEEGQIALKLRDGALTVDFGTAGAAVT